MGRFKDVRWNLPTAPTGKIENWEAARLAVLMDIRDELKLINDRLQCHETMAIPRMLKRISANTAKPRKPKLGLVLLCVSASLWFILTTPRAQAATITLTADAPAQVRHRGDELSATVTLQLLPGELATGVDWSLARPDVFHVLARTLTGSPFTDPLTIDPTPPGTDLGATVPIVTTPCPPGNWTLAVLLIQIDPAAPDGLYELTTTSPPGAGLVDATFTDHPFAQHVGTPLTIAAIPDPASGAVLLTFLLVIELGVLPRRSR